MTNSSAPPPTAASASDDASSLGSWLDSKSPEYFRVLYDLEINLAHVGRRPSAAQVWKVNANEEFEERSTLKRTLSSWSDFSSKDVETLFQTCKKGFEFDSHLGLTVLTGGCEFANPSQYPETGSQCVFVKSEVILGRSRIVGGKANCDASRLLPGYDSLHVDKDSDFGDASDIESMLGEGEEDGNGGVMRYKTFSGKNMQAKYIVRFTLEDETGISDDKQGGLDVYDRTDYFDVIKWLPVSLRERINKVNVGGPNTGTLIGTIAEETPLVTVTEAYNQALEVSQEQSGEVEQAKTALKMSLETLDDKVRLVNMSYASGEEAIMQAAKDAMAQLLAEKERKLHSLRSTELELRRKIKEIDSVEDHLFKNMDIASPLNFLRIWRAHAEKRANLTGNSDIMSILMREAEEVALVTTDILVSGSLEVSSRDVTGVKQEEEDEANQSLTPQALSNVNVSLAGGNPYTTYALNAASKDFHSPSKMGMIMNPFERPEKIDIPHTKIKPTLPPVPSPTQGSRKYRSIKDNQEVVGRFKQFQISTMAERKHRQLGKDIDAEQMFGDSHILQDLSNASNLFHALPGVTPYINTHLIFQGGENAPPEFSNPNIDMLLRSLHDVSNPTVFIFKSGEYIFGAYAASAWSEGFDQGELTGEFFGKPNSFLFSVTLDTKIPFVGKTLDVERIEQARRAGYDGAPHKLLAHEVQFVGEDYLSFGSQDLIIAGDLSTCMSNLENSFGVGLDSKTNEASTFLAGQKRFKIEAVEVFEIISD
ncbi:hypothetical protein TrLO_g13541 [Triparma laevis f. longispina]|uniref:TLDc domain-containing protein n=1 Tax=Triparma laevis f. longispina TaxID=1714387 RepID=A0A9W7F462_9STRA|nr:hypothetical protein TrLO_g13541 [Triparma laevis f. longispina]